MSTECLIPLGLGEVGDEELELAYAPGFIEYLMSPAPGDAQSLGELMANRNLASERRAPDSGSTLKNWLAQILLD